MEETAQVMLVDTEKFMKQYMWLSQNKLETEVARSYASLVKKEVQAAQDRADQIVNALTSRSKPPDFAAARNALSQLARGPDVVVAHWQPFIALVAEVLPPREEGEVDASAASDVDEAAESAELKGMRALFGKIGAVLPVASARDLRELREGFAMLGNAIGTEFGKRGMAFEKDGSAAVLERISAELEVAVKPEPLPKDFAFSDRRVMELRAIADSQRIQLQAADAKIAEMKDDAAAVAADVADAESVVKTAREDLLRILNGEVAPGTTYTGEAGTLAEAVGMVQSRLAERDAEISVTHQTRDEMAKAADTAVARADAAEQALLAEKKRAGELEHEVEQHKKKSSKTK